jgi:hypothetical protein
VNSVTQPDPESPSQPFGPHRLERLTALTSTVIACSPVQLKFYHQMFQVVCSKPGELCERQTIYRSVHHAEVFAYITYFVCVAYRMHIKLRGLLRP